MSASVPHALHHVPSFVERARHTQRKRRGRKKKKKQRQTMRKRRNWPNVRGIPGDRGKKMLGQDCLDGNALKLCLGDGPHHHSQMQLHPLTDRHKTQHADTQLTDKQTDEHMARKCSPDRCGTRQSLTYADHERKKKRKETTTPFGVTLMRSRVLHRAAHETSPTHLVQPPTLWPLCYP